MELVFGLALACAIAGCERKPEPPKRHATAQETKKTLEDWYKAVPEATRSDIEKQIAKELPRVDKDEVWKVGSALMDAGKGLTMEEYLPVFLKALK
jgi:hypothetical protein